MITGGGRGKISNLIYLSWMWAHEEKDLSEHSQALLHICRSRWYVMPNLLALYCLSRCEFKDLQGVSPTAVVYQSSWLLRHVVLPAARTVPAWHRIKISPCMLNRRAVHIEVERWVVDLTLELQIFGDVDWTAVFVVVPGSLFSMKFGSWYQSLLMRQPSMRQRYNIFPICNHFDVITDQLNCWLDMYLLGHGGWVLSKCYELSLQL
jgi:hypothetical protein